MTGFGFPLLLILLIAELAAWTYTGLRPQRRPGATTTTERRR